MILAKKSFRFFLLTGIFFLCCSKIVKSQNPVQDSKREIKTQIYNLSDFHEVELNIPGHIYVSQDSTCLVKAEAAQDILDQISVVNEDHELIIQSKIKGWLPPDNDALKITVHTPQLKGIEINGQALGFAQTPIKTPEMSLEVSGSGELKVKEIFTNKLYIKTNRTGKITSVSGNANAVEMDVYGGGNIDAANLSSRSVYAAVDGDGTIHAGKTDVLNAEVRGSGNIFYTGNPTTLEKQVSGKGFIGPKE